LTVPTPSGPVAFRIAATTTNLAWSPGALFLSSADYTRLWRTNAPTALGVTPVPGQPVARVASAIERAIGPSSGLEVTSSGSRERRIDALANEGLAQLGRISTLLLLAAILAMAAALTSAIWQRRASLAGLRLSGVRPSRLRLILLVESALMLGAGCATGAVMGIYGQLVIDGYLEHVTGFPVASLTTSPRPLQVFTIVIAVVLAIVTVPGWLASRVRPTLAFNE
jgi:putative ABC transport system permease protein